MDLNDIIRRNLNHSHEWSFLMVQIMICSNVKHKLFNAVLFQWSIPRYFIGWWTVFTVLEINGNRLYLPLQTGDKNYTCIETNYTFRTLSLKELRRVWFVCFLTDSIASPNIYYKLFSRNIDPNIFYCWEVLMYLTFKDFFFLSMFLSKPFFFLLVWIYYRLQFIYS